MKTYTKKGLETVIAGHEAEKLVKKRLWSYGYRVYHVKHRTAKGAYDLLVSSHIKVEVKSGKAHTMKDGTLRWHITMPRCVNFNVLAVVLRSPIKTEKPIMFFYKTNEYRKFFQSRKKKSCFPLVTSVTFGENSKFFDKKYKSIKRVFGDIKKD